MIVLRKLLKKDWLLISVVGVSCLIIGLLVATNLDLTTWGIAQTEEELDTTESLKTLSRAYEDAASEVIPAVVNIDVEVTYKTRQQQYPYFEFSPFGEDFFNEFFGEDFFAPFESPRSPNQGGEYKSYGQGSGVIVSENGYILTNNHVVQDADKITVRLFDNREFRAKIIGTDPKTDIAVIKIEGDDLPVAKLGDSDDLKVGKIVLAIGHPLRQSHTVTAGIISAVGRSRTGLAEYEDFIQTDAAINPGNSGGPLINLDGEVIGINTAIFSYTGGYMGIGFSIPINMAKDVMNQLIENGRVVRGWLGVYIQNLTPELTEQFDIDDIEGCLISDVVDDSPAEKAGLEPGDIIVEFNGKNIEGVNELRMQVAGTEPGKKVTIKLIRDGRTISKKVVIAELESDEQEFIQPDEEEETSSYIGIQVQEITPRIAQQLGWEKDEGVVITSVAEGSPAYYGGLQRGDIVLEINRNKIEDMGDFKKYINMAKKSENILFYVWSGGNRRYIVVELSD
jgi:serine protease Do